MLNYWNNYDQPLLNCFYSITSPTRSLQVIPVIQQRPQRCTGCPARHPLNLRIGPATVEGSDGEAVRLLDIRDLPGRRQGRQDQIPDSRSRYAPVGLQAAGGVGTVPLLSSLPDTNYTSTAFVIFNAAYSKQRAVILCNLFFGGSLFRLIDMFPVCGTLSANKMGRCPNGQDRNDPCPC